MKKEKFINALLILGILFTACTNDVSTSNDPVNDKNKDEPEIVADVPPSSPYTELGLGINGTAGKEARYVTFGSFPQTQLPEDSDITVDEARFVKVGAYTYYKGSDGEWYAKFTVNGIEKYFLVEPIKWRILTDNYNDTGKKLLLAENILINCSFYDQDEASNRRGTKPAPNNYEHSRIRAYLNGYSYDKEGETSDIFESRGFLQTAFSEEEQKIYLSSVTSSARGTFYISSMHSGFIAQASEENTLKDNCAITLVERKAKSNESKLFGSDCTRIYKLAAVYSQKGYYSTNKITKVESLLRLRFKRLFQATAKNFI